MEKMARTKIKESIVESGMKPSELASELEKINSPENGGENLVVIKHLVELVRSGNISGARAYATHDSDKISGTTPDGMALRKIIKEELFCGEEEHPWSLLDELSTPTEE